MAMSVFPSYNENIGSHHPRDASFSSYLDTVERDFVRDLATTIHKHSPLIPSSASASVKLGRSRSPRMELSVFGAERYFGNKDPSTRKGGSRRHRHRRGGQDGVDLPPRKPRNNHNKSPTPSIKSESSFSSQIALLPIKKAANGLRLLSGLQCKGSCMNKNSVCTDHRKPVQSASHQNDLIKPQKEDHFTFPVMNTASSLLEESRKSLEVFGFHKVEKEHIAKSLGRKISILSWDAIPNTKALPFPFPFPSSATTKTLEDDLDSDASSDLFEIPVVPSQTSDSDNFVTTSHYAPSEASIQWSAVTAEFSAVSNDEKLADKTMISTEDNISKYQKLAAEKKEMRSYSGLGCRSHKAVDVIGDYVNHESRGVRPKIVACSRKDYQIPQSQRALFLHK